MRGWCRAIKRAASVIRRPWTHRRCEHAPYNARATRAKRASEGAVIAACPACFALPDPTAADAAIVCVALPQRRQPPVRGCRSTAKKRWWLQESNSSSVGRSATREPQSRLASRRLPARTPPRSRRPGRRGRRSLPAPRCRAGAGHPTPARRPVGTRWHFPVVSWRGCALAPVQGRSIPDSLGSLCRPGGHRHRREPISRSAVQLLGRLLFPFRHRTRSSFCAVNLSRAARNGFMRGGAS